MTEQLLTRKGEAGLPPAIPLLNYLAVLVAVGAGAILAAVVLPAWVPDLAASLLGTAPKAYWYLSRASAVTAYALLWISMVFGLTITNRMARVWPGGPSAFDLHQHTGLLGLALALFHGLILLGDKYIGYSLPQLVVPFASFGYRLVAVGLGQMAFYLMAFVGLTFYIQRYIGTRLWRTIHYLSFVTFALALAHGLFAGTDTGAPWVVLLYLTSGVSLCFLTVYRVLVRVFMPSR